MSTHLSSNADVKQLEDLISRLMKGERDPEAAKESSERMERMKEATRARVGIVNVSVDLVRELRDR